MSNISYSSNEGKLYFFNFSPWRMMQIEPFFYAPNNKKFICKNLEDAIRNGIDKDSKIFIYGIKRIADTEEFAKREGIPIYRIEDAFIRSVALGSGFSRPYSLGVDSRGVYFDPSRESDLEYIIQNYNFTDELITRAKNLRKKVIEYKLSKYNHLEHSKIEVSGRYDKRILVVGQVSDDMSIKYGAFGLNNEDLLQMVREKNPNSYIIYKPHPDVLSKNREGVVPPKILKQCSNLVVESISIDSAVDSVDEVHTLTSGAGFDALIRGKRVVTYGMPFYASWGLTTDFRECKRRTRKITLDELVCASLILYPRYISPKSLKFCEVEQTIEELKAQQERYFNSRIYRLLIDTKGYILPRTRRAVRGVLKPFNIKI
jgi:capsular polysaccharide export protein